ncbi:MAG: hypothetical protein ACLF0G_12775 [Candidatus Brocadiia bacterium]
MRPCLLVLLAILATAAEAGAPRRPPAPAPPGRREPSGWLDGIIGEGTSAARSVATGSVAYVRNRVLDAVDVVELNVGVGPGAKAGVEYGLARTTLGWVQSQRIGLDGRQAGIWSERNASYGIFPASVAFLPFELVREAGDTWQALAVYGFELGTFGIERIERDRLATTTVLYHEAKAAGPVHERLGDAFSFGGDVHAGLLGARARVKPLELFDFVLGFAGVNLDRHLAHPAPHRKP